LRLMFAQNRFLWGENRSGNPSRFLDDLPDHVLERRSDDILSAFAWAGAEGSERARVPEQRMRGGRLEPFRQVELPRQDVSIEFNQDVSFDDASQDKEIEQGSRVEHPTFGKGTVTTKRGDVVEIRFDGGQKKTFALSIAPLKVI
jgi:hypothetical protein